MDKSDIMKEVHAELKKRRLVRLQSDTKDIVDVVFETMFHNLAKGRDVKLRGFGNFSVSPLEFTNVADGSPGTRMVIRFKASKVLKDKLNEKLR